MSTKKRRSSEYSSGNKFIKEEKDEIKITKEEETEAKSHLYSILFSEKLTWFALIPSLLVGIVSPLLWYLFGQIVNILSSYQGINFEQKWSEFFKIAINLFYLSIYAGISMFFNSLLWIRLGAKLSTSIRQTLFENMMKSDITFFDITPIGNIMTLLSEDAQLVQNAFGKMKSNQVSSLALFFFGVILSFITNWKLSLIAYLVIPINLIYISLFSNSITTNADLSYKHTSIAMTIAEESISFIRTIKSFNRENKQLELFNEQTNESQKYEKEIGFLMAWMFNVSITFIWLSIIGLLYYGSILVSNYELSVGELVSLFGYIINSTLSLVALQSTMSSEQKAIAAGARILKLSKYQGLIDFSNGIEISNFKGEIEFKNVSFKYPTRNVYVLKNVSFKISPGQMAAFVGHSGSGKSTIVQLLERFYDIEEGEILLDGINIKEINSRWLHQVTSLVSQEPNLFKMSIEENIKYGYENATFEEIRESAILSNSLTFIEQMENKIQTLIGEKGLTISGGQRQRIAIARAIIKKPIILITDEATSALDASNEKEVQIALDTVMKNRTSIIVAHRLSTIINSNIIFVFDNGEIKERGNHEELLNLKGVYYNLIERQLNK